MSTSTPQPTTPASQTTAQDPTPEAHAAFTASLKSVASNHDSELRERAQNLHANATALAEQEAALHKATAELARQNEQWAGVADAARAGLKEFGDVQNWAELIERDLLVLGETVRLVEEAGERDGEGGEEEEVRDGVVGGKRKDDGRVDGEAGPGAKGWFRWW